MPRGVTRSAVSTSEDKNAIRHSLKLSSYYCACNEFILVIDKPLSLLARRRSDASYILPNASVPTPSTAPLSPHASQRSYRLNAVHEEDPIIVKGTDRGFEKRRRFRCPRCELEVGYEAGMGAAKKGPCTFILHGALTERQAIAPPGALDEDPAGALFAQLRSQA